jgi:hypothetical protein
MSAETDYIRAELNAAKASLNNQSLRIAANKKIDQGLALLDARDGLEATGAVLPDMDVATVGNLYDGIEGSLNAVNANDVAFKDKAAILSELSELAALED